MSVRWKIIMVLSAFTLGIILFYTLLNNFAFEKFYLTKKKDLLVKTYITINNLYKDGTKDIPAELEKLDVNKSLNITIMNPDENEIIFSRAKGEFNRVSFRLARPFPEEGDIHFGAESDAKPTRRLIVSSEMETEVMYDDGKCLIQNRYDRFFESYNIDLSAQLDNGYMLHIRTPMESITESADISNSFILIVGLILFFVGSIFVWIISRQITKPILELSDIANEMAHLNFNIKYKVRGQDEVNVLGKSINTMSYRLEQTISELKTANTQLQTDLKDKTRTDELRRGFLSNVSHELKTPIALIQGYAEGLRDNIASDGESRRFYCDVILDESGKMDLMIKKLLTLMQIESGDDAVAISRFDIAGLIRSIIMKNSMVFEQKGIAVSFDFVGELYVWSDEFFIDNVLVNYLSNAVNHVSGDMRIEFRLDICENTARISVFNTGGHIADEDVDKIWDSFYKADKARTREYGGSGIGLAVVSAVMNALGRPFGAENVEGGVEFFIEMEVC